MWDFFLNKFIKTSYVSPYSEDLRWRAIWIKEILDEVAAASRMASLGFRPDCHEFHLAVQENISELYSAPVLTD